MDKEIVSRLEIYLLLNISFKINENSKFLKRPEVLLCLERLESKGLITGKSCIACENSLTPKGEAFIKSLTTIKLPELFYITEFSGNELKYKTFLDRK